MRFEILNVDAILESGSVSKLRLVAATTIETKIDGVWKKDSNDAAMEAAGY